MSIIISFVARGLSAIRSQIFCYTAISSSGIIGILPGFLIRTSLHVREMVSLTELLVVASDQLVGTRIEEYYQW